MNNGTASKLQSGQLAELASAIIRQLPHIEGLSGDTAQGWIENGAALRKALEKALASPYAGKRRDSFPLRVNYDLSVESLVIHGKYDWGSDEISMNNFPTTKHGEVAEVLELVHFNAVLTSDEVSKELDKMGLRPAELYELLTLGKEYPNVQRQFPVLALGSVWHDRGSSRFVPYLTKKGIKRLLNLSYLDVQWGKRCRFAAIRK